MKGLIMGIFTFWRCLTGPQLLRQYKTPDSEGFLYRPNAMEHYSNNIIRSLNMVWSIGLYTSPLVLPVLHRKGYFSQYRFLGYMKYFIVFGVMFLGTVFIRGLGRWLNREYTAFLVPLDSAMRTGDKESRRLLQRYDFSFWAWPVDFRWSMNYGNQQMPSVLKTKSARSSTIFDSVFSIPCHFISYVIASSVGRRMMYPGSVGLLQAAMEPNLLEGRTRLVEEFRGERYKVQACDGNHIDTMVVDRRKKTDYPNRNILVICCEGNAGFYEVGIMETALKAKYSVLGWNHPGFSGSTGVPYPANEVNAIDAVMQFALHHLNFRQEDIVVYAWSIGGYTATWAAMNYPSIKGLVLDATFDDVVPLAVARMPQSWKPLVVRTLRDYLNLNIAEQLNRYNGPVRLYRRLRDEIITTEGDGQHIEFNRGNNLLEKVFIQRYPLLMDGETIHLLRQYLASKPEEQAVMMSRYVRDNSCDVVLERAFESDRNTYPSTLGQGLTPSKRQEVLLCLVSKYLVDYDSTHCTPLPSRLFQLPWTPGGHVGEPSLGEPGPARRSSPRLQAKDDNHSNGEWENVDKDDCS